MNSKIDVTNKKLLRKLSYTWDLLINPNHYIVPRTFEDYKKIGGLDPEVKVNGKDWFLSERIKKELRNFSDVIYNIHDVRSSVTYNTVYESVLIGIEEELNLVFVNKQRRELDEVLSKMTEQISNKRKEYEFYFVLRGLELKGIKGIDFNSVKIFYFTKECAERIIAAQQKHQVIDEFDKHLFNFLEDNFINNVCIKCSSYGDYEKAYELACTAIRKILNFWRFVVCILSYKRIYENLIKINIAPETYTSRGELLTIELPDGLITLSYGRGRKTFESLPIDKDRISDLQDNLFFNDIVSILSSPIRNEIEGTIATSIFWAGEAQDDFNYDVAFLKYWTALECIFTRDNKSEITHSLAKGVSILITFSGYRFMKIDDIDKVYKCIKKLYKLRSKIVHKGIRGGVNELNLVNMCKFTVWTIMSLLYLRSKGYKTMEQVDAETTRLYEASRNKP